MMLPFRAIYAAKTGQDEPASTHAHLLIMFINQETIMLLESKYSKMLTGAVSLIQRRGARSTLACSYCVNFC